MTVTKDTTATAKTMVDPSRPRAVVANFAAMAPIDVGGLGGLLDDDTMRRLIEQAAPYARAFARISPTAAIVPAIALRGAPVSMRLAIAVALSAPIAAAFPVAPGAASALALTLARDAIAGIPLAIVVATPLWIAAQVGAVADATRGAPEANQAPLPAADAARGSLSTLAALIAASAWLSSGGLLRALLLLTSTTPSSSGVAAWALAARALTDGIRLGFALSSGVLVAAIVLEISLAAIARVASPISPQPIAVVARPLVSIVALALSIEAAIAVLAR